MEDILASIKKVIAEKRTCARPLRRPRAAGAASKDDGEEVLELDEPLAPPLEMGPPLIDEGSPRTIRHSLETLSTVAASGSRGAAGQPAGGHAPRDATPILSNGSTIICPE